MKVADEIVIVRCFTLWFTYLNNTSWVWKYFRIINVLIIFSFFCQLPCFEDTYAGGKKNPKQQIPREIVLLAHNFIAVLIPLKIVTCVLQSLVRCVNDIKEKNVQFLPAQ